MAKTKNKKKSVKREAERSVGAKGLGGWLIVISLVFVFSIISYFSIIFSNMASMGCSILVMNIFMLFSSIFVIYLYFYKKRKAVFWIIAWLWISSIVRFLSDYIVDKGVLSELFLYLIFPIIWTFYFIKSVRVKNTFVNE